MVQEFVPYHIEKTRPIFSFGYEANILSVGNLFFFRLETYFSFG